MCHNKQQYRLSKGKHYASLMVTGRGTIPAPKRSRSKLGIHPRLQDSCQPWRGCCRIDGRRCGTVSYTWTEWSLYLLPELQAPPEWQYWRDHDGQNVHNFLFWKEFVDQFGAAFSDPRLWQGATGSSATYYVILTHIITYYFTPEGLSLIHIWRCRRRG